MPLTHEETDEVLGFIARLCNNAGWKSYGRRIAKMQRRLATEPQPVRVQPSDPSEETPVYEMVVPGEEPTRPRFPVAESWGKPLRGEALAQCIATACPCGGTFVIRDAAFDVLVCDQCGEHQK